MGEARHEQTGGFHASEGRERDLERERERKRGERSRDQRRFTNKSHIGILWRVGVSSLLYWHNLDRSTIMLTLCVSLYLVR